MRVHLRIRHLGLAIASSVVALATIVACGRGGDDAASSVGFDGVYRTDSEGIIGAIAFANGEDYMLMSSSCWRMECTEFGSFVYDDDARVLTLTNAKTGAVKKLPVSDITTEGYDVGEALGTLDLVQHDASLITEGGANVDTQGDGSVVDAGEKLLDGGDAGSDAGAAPSKKPTKVVDTAKVGQQDASKVKPSS
ncbi:MAG TPA: hypothetical protein VIF62_33470, partial [Labilithrix sp.]